MKLRDFSERIIPGISISDIEDLKKRLYELLKHNISSIGLFFENVNYENRKIFYQILLDSSIKNIPLVHIYNDYTEDELKFLQKNFKTQFFTIHENDFDCLDNWPNYLSRLFVELDFNDIIPERVDIDKIGGFCIDLSHFQSAKMRKTKEYDFIKKRLDQKKYFQCNHLNGYSPSLKLDMHNIVSLKDFDYLMELPLELFGEVIALEMHNNIDEQLKFKEYLSKMLNKRFDI